MEPWLTNSITDVPPLQAVVLYSFQHARQELEKWTQGLSEDELWNTNDGIGAIGFHIRHIAASVDRLVTYAAGGQLDKQQLLTLAREIDRISKSEAFEELETTFARVGPIIRSFQASQYNEIREIGRKKLQVPLGVLLAHIAEHTQRHVGSIIILAKLARSKRA